jgi:type I site-specific restriction-modification system R (restriction) subunit
MESTEVVDDFDSAFDEFTENAESTPKDNDVVVTEEVTATEVTATEVTATESVEEAPVEDDIWAEADEGLKTEYDKLREDNSKLSHQAKSNAGRIGALQRKLNEFQATSPAGGNQPSATEVAEAMKTPEAWASFNEEYPDIHDAIESRLEVERSQNQEAMNRALQPLRAAEEERHVNGQYAAL